MTNEQLKEEEKKLLPFELLSKEQLLESGFIQDFIVNPHFMIIRFKCGKALYITGDNMRVEDKVKLVHINSYEDIQTIMCTQMCSNFYNSGILSKEDYEYILECGLKYLELFKKNAALEKIKQLEKQIEQLKEQVKDND